MHDVKFFKSSILLSSKEEAYFWEASYKQIKELLCKRNDDPPWDRDQILSEIFNRFNVSFNHGIFEEEFCDDNYFANYGYDCDYPYEQYFKNHPLDNTLPTSVIFYSEYKTNPKILGHVVQGFFRKFRSNGFFGLSFFGGYMIVTLEKIEVIKTEDLIEQRRLTHERSVR
jgi:hypothetical protein